MRTRLVAATAIDTSDWHSLYRTEPPREAPLTEVTLGVFLNQMPTMSLRENKFVVDFYLWFRWKGSAKPYNTFEIIGGKIDSKQQTTLETTKLDRSAWAERYSRAWIFRLCFKRSIARR